LFIFEEHSWLYVTIVAYGTEWHDACTMLSIFINKNFCN